MRHIALGFGYTCPQAPICLPPLRNVETLKYIKGNALLENNAVLDLTNIRSLGIIFERSQDVHQMLRALTESRRLSSLDMRSKNSSMAYLDLEPLSQCHHLSKLFIEGKVQEDPYSSRHVLKFLPASIVKLTLVDCKMKRDPMGVLGELPHLRTLHLWYKSYTGTKMVCSANEFLQLDFLYIRSLEELEEWQIEEGAMPHLQSLFLDNLPNVRIFPEGLRYVTALKEMKLESMKRSLAKRIQVIDGREGEDFSKVRHIPSIQIKYMR